MIGVDVCLYFPQRCQNQNFRQLLKNILTAATTKDDSLTALNTAFTCEGAYIYVPKNKVVEKPVQIIHFPS